MAQGGFMIELYLTANMIIIVDCIIISILLITIYVQRRKQIKEGMSIAIVWLAIGLIMLGLTRLSNYTDHMIHNASFVTVSTVIAATFMTISAIFMPRIVISFTKRISYDQVEQANLDLEKRLRVSEIKQEDLKRSNALLLTRLNNLELLLETEGWTNEKATALAEMRGVLMAVQKVT